MSDRPFDYYAGYPGQRATPKWVGIALGSLFGGMLLVAVGIGVHVFAPARTANASTAPLAIEQPVMAAKADAPAVTESEMSDTADEPAAPSKHASRGHHRGSTHGKKVAAKPAFAKSGVKYQKAQKFAKAVSSSKRDKKSRDDLDKMLGL